MARKPSVRYWPTRGTWTDESGQTHHGAFCCTLNGRQYVLAVGPDDSAKQGPVYCKATRAFGDLFCLKEAPDAKDNNPCRVILELWLRETSTTAKPSTLKIRHIDAAAFCATEMGDWPVHKLKKSAVLQWLSEMRRERTIKAKMPGGRECTRKCKWGDSMVRRVIASLMAGFNWAARNDYITRNPLKGLQRPASRSRSRECLVSPEDHRWILAATKGQFHDFIVCLEATGCRPGELLMSTAADWRDDLGALVFYGQNRRLAGEAEHKTSRKNRDRRIYFTGAALAVMRERVRRFPKGALWHERYSPGKPWDQKNLEFAFRRLRKRVGLPKLTAYSYRHTYATHYLESGGNIDDLAALLGNSPEVLRQHYCHLLENTGRMRQLAEGFTAARTDTPPRVLPFDEAAG
jgi:integrase